MKLFKASPTPNATLLLRFWKKISIDPYGCWAWIGQIQSGGYGRMEIKYKPFLAHRLSFEWLVGPIPDGLQIDHLCRNRNCVNPAHLEPVTNRENGLRGTGISAINSKKTHCPQGHPLSEDNLFINKSGRQCRICARASSNRAYHKDAKRRNQKRALNKRLAKLRGAP